MCKSVWTLTSEFGYFLAKQLTRYDYGRNMHYGLTTSDIILRKYTKGKSYVNSSTYYNTQKNGGGNYNRMQILLSVHIRPPSITHQLSAITVNLSCAVLIHQSKIPF